MLLKTQRLKIAYKVRRKFKGENTNNNEEFQKIYK